jgi:hypothetical protein
LGVFAYKSRAFCVGWNRCISPDNAARTLRMCDLMPQELSLWNICGHSNVDAEFQAFHFGESGEYPYHAMGLIIDFLFACPPCQKLLL